jgi:hypothetical protein
VWLAASDDVDQAVAVEVAGDQVDYGGPRIIRDGAEDLARVNLPVAFDLTCRRRHF